MRFWVALRCLNSDPVVALRELFAGIVAAGWYVGRKRAA
jgi:hypothetical protein